MACDLSIIIPVIDEAGQINETIERIRRQAFKGNVRIIIVDGDPAGSTIHNVTDPQVTCLTAPKGRARQMNAGAGAACGQLLLFLHADTMLPENGLTRMARLMDDPSIDAGAFDLTIRKKGAAYRVIERCASLRSRLTRLPYGDQAIFIRQDYFFRIGRYRDIPIMEDVELMQRIKKKGGNIGFVDAKVLTSARRWEKEGPVFCTLRNWLLIFLYLCGTAPEKLAGFYRNH